AFPLLGESSHWQYKFPLPVEGVPTAGRMEIPLPGVCTAMMKKLPVKENWQDDVLPSLDNEDKVFNPGILSHEKSVKIITRVTQEKKLAISFASWLFEGFDPPFYELLAFKEVKENSKKDKIISKPDKNEKRGEAGKSQKQLQ
nr:hypothetical protein [Tanacetum cinerariifolium]